MSKPECRICLENTGKLLTVCECKGYSGYVHAECIEKWIRESGRDTCEICQAEFKMTTKHVTSMYCCSQCIHRFVSLNIPSDLLAKQIETSTVLSLCQVILYLLYSYEQYTVISLINTCIACFLIFITFCTCKYESRFYVQNFALRIISIFMFIRIVFVMVGYMDMSTLVNSCVECHFIHDNCSWTCKRDMQYGKQILTQLDSIVFQSIFFVGTFIFVKIVADVVISSKVLKIEANEDDGESPREEVQPLISEEV